MSARGESSFGEAIAVLGDALAGDTRHAIIEELVKARTFERAVLRLRDGMRAHRFEASGRTLLLDKVVRRLDNRTRQDGFHVLHDWDGKADRFCADTIPADMADFARHVALPDNEPARRVALSVLLDYYFLYVIALLALRAWDAGDAGENLDAVARLLALLQGLAGSEQRFARDAETLLLIATSHFEPDVTAYERLRRRFASLDETHRRRLALAHAPLLGCHLRFGLAVTCAGDLHALRDDNAPDYPWLATALAALLEAWIDLRAAHTAGAGCERDAIVEALLCGLSADPRAFLGQRPPAPLGGCERELATIRETVAGQRETLLAEFAAHLPRADAYSPLSFDFNFPHNLVKGMVVDALVRGEVWPLALNDLLTSFPREADLDAVRRSLASTLMDHAVRSPDTIRGRPHPAVVYDVRNGSRAFERTVRAL